MRITKLTHTHQTLDQADSGYNDLGSWDYTYDAASNLLTADQTGGMGHLDADRVYGYDTLHRLITAKLTDTQDWDAAVQQTTWYQYDDLGNRISHSERDASPIAYAHDRANRLTDWAGHAQAYDLAGNVTLAFSAAGDQSYKYRYDHLNQLTAVYDATDTTRKAAFTYDALGRRIEHINDVLGRTTDYYFDGASELAEYRGSGDGDRMRYTVHGVAYIDEHLMMMVDVAGTSNDRPYYYVQDRLYNVWAMIDRAGAVVERYAYDAYGLPLIRESAGRGDMNNDTLIDADPDTDKTRFLDARDGVIWDSRADMDDDGDIDDDDVLLWSDADNVWPESAPTVAQAFSDVGNPFMFQGVPHFALDTADDAETAVLPLNHHRARFADPVTGRWGRRDPIGYRDSMNLYSYLGAAPAYWVDPEGTKLIIVEDEGYAFTLEVKDALQNMCPCFVVTVDPDTGEVKVVRWPPACSSDPAVNARRNQEHNDCVRLHLAGCKILSDLVANGETEIRKQTPGKGKDDSDYERKSGNKPGVIRWSPKAQTRDAIRDSRGFITKRIGQVPAWLNLVHELVHAYDDVFGLWSNTKLGGRMTRRGLQGGVSEAEVRAVRGQNQVAREAGIKDTPPRTTLGGQRVPDPEAPLFP